MQMKKCKGWNCGKDGKPIVQMKYILLILVLVFFVIMFFVYR